MPRPARARNDLGQYDDLVGEWWAPRGKFAMLHWIARARAELIPPASQGGRLLVDLACGGGLMAPYVQQLGYQHVGVDLTASALREAAAHGVRVVRADVRAVPLRGGCADVVSVGEILEHVPDPGAVITEAARLLRPGGLLVLDTIAATRRAQLLVVDIAERIPGMAPPGIHDPDLFVDREQLVRAAERAGVPLRLRGIRLALPSALAWTVGLRSSARLVPTRSTAVLFQGRGVKNHEPGRAAA